MRRLITMHSLSLYPSSDFHLSPAPRFSTRSSASPLGLFGASSLPRLRKYPPITRYNFVNVEHGQIDARATCVWR